MRFFISIAGVFTAAILAATCVMAGFSIETVDSLVARDFEELELRRGGGAAAGGGHASAVASASKNKLRLSKPKDESKSKSKSKTKKPKRPKRCKDGGEPVESRELDELVERGGKLGKLAGHLRCPGEEHHARELLEELVRRYY
ncbi:hypothetical protein FA13DRAFT_1117726 [Coprinellus micaceus]|uniref:Uncharacterized protein n=1 Tax=Coprinellus micaceus TaxID=71717 RepID=A0A4Y7RJN8_COPMI|nr:hypothetical protein FA13DRAFT_1117726 [Coprinellus micaceus]